MKIRSIIIEDEVLARTSLEKLCSKTPAIELLAAFEDAEAAKEFLATQDVDLIFLDVELPGMSGIEFLENLPVLPQIVFSTSHEEYAYQAFEFDVTDYLKKPISIDRFNRAIEKCLQIQELKKERADLSKGKELYVKVDKKLVRVPLDEILYFENAGDYISIVTPRDKYLIYGTIKSLAQRLTHPRLIKVHRSYIINLDFVKDIDDASVVIKDKVIPISRAHRSALLSSLHIL